MSNKQRGSLVIFIIVISSVMISACTQSLSTPPAATPTLPPDLFVSPIATGGNPMDMIQEFAKQTSVAQTTIANGGTPATPQPVGTVITPQAETVIPSTPTVPAPSTPTNAVLGTAVPANTSAPNATAVPPGVRPPTYTLQSGEFPYCIARRFNVDPDALLSLSGLTSPDLYSVGDKLTIPQSGAFPGSRMLASHPTTYSVLSGDETVYGVACKFGDVDPAAIATANNISVSAKLTAGQKLQIP